MTSDELLKRLVAINQRPREQRDLEVDHSDMDAALLQFAVDNSPPSVGARILAAYNRRPKEYA